MPHYLYNCATCGLTFTVYAPMGEQKNEECCGNCKQTAYRIFTRPQLCTQPDKSRDENRWWWLKPGEHYNMESKKEMDKDDAAKWEADHARFEENRRQYSNKA